MEMLMLTSTTSLSKNSLAPHVLLGHKNFIRLAPTALLNF